MKLPGISKIKSLFAALAFAPNNSKHTEELFSLGGTDYMTARAREMLTQYSQTHQQGDLEMAIQLLATVHVLRHTKDGNGPATSTRKKTS